MHLASSAVPPYRVNNRDWGHDFKKLDLVSHPEGFVVWRDRALGHLAKDRPDVKAWLLWAEKQAVEIDQTLETIGARDTGLAEGPEGASTVA